MLSLNLKAYLFLGLALLLITLTTSTFFFRSELKQAKAELALAQALNQKQANAIFNYENQLNKLNHQLNETLLQAEKHKAQLSEVLQNEKNKNWTNSPVPDDVHRLFNQRTKEITTPHSVPTNNRMQKH